MKVTVDWTDEEDAFIRAHYHDWPTAEIARRLPGRTRNGVIGRADRLGLRQHRPVVTSPHEFKALLEARRLRRRERDNMSRQLRRGVHGPRGEHKMTAHNGGAARAKPLTPAEELPTQVTQGVGLLDLQTHHCRYLLGYDTQGIPVYCGLPKVELGGSYCAGHRAICYQPGPKWVRGVVFRQSAVNY